MFVLRREDDARLKRKGVAVAVRRLQLLVRSNVSPRPRSTCSGKGILSRLKLAASVSSVSALDAAKPWLRASRLVQPWPRKRAANRGLKSIPYWL